MSNTTIKFQQIEVAITYRKPAPQHTAAGRGYKWCAANQHLASESLWAAGERTGASK